MSKVWYFDIDKKGSLIQTTKLYINSSTYEIEYQKTPSNFAVDTLMAETISLLNKKGYKTLSSNAGHVYHYFIRKRTYLQEDLKIDSYGNKFMYVGYHNGTPVKYELISQDDSSHLSTDSFKVTFPVIILEIIFDKPYQFKNLPGNWYFNKFDNSIVCKIDYDFDTIDFKTLDNIIVKTNQELLQWAKRIAIVKEWFKVLNSIRVFTPVGHSFLCHESC